MALAIGIDLGGTNIFGALVDGQGHAHAFARRPTPVAEGHGAVMAAMYAMVRELLGHTAEQVLGIGLGIPGLLDREAGMSVTAPNLFWRDVPVLEPFRREFGLPVDMDNDVRVGALAELHFGAGRRYRSFAFVTLGTGIGSGIVLDRQLYRGPYGTAGELGHMVIRPGGPACNCGSHGCLEALASGPAIRRRVAEALGAGRDGGTSLLRSVPQDARDAAALAVAARAGDAFANTLWAEIGTDFGLGMLNYYNLMGPEAVIVGGGVSLAGDLLLEPARRVAQEFLMPGIREHVVFVPAELRDEAGAIGAATLVPGLV